MTTTAMVLAASSHTLNPTTMSLIVIAGVLFFGFVLIKWAGATWWVLLLGIIFGILLAATKFLGPQIMSQLHSWTNGNLL
jgi:hypothetical protein